MSDHQSAPPSGGHGRLAASLISFAGFSIIVVAVILDGRTTLFDRTVFGFASLVRSIPVTLVARGVTTLGAFPVVVGVAVLAALMLWVRTRDLVKPAVLLSSVAVTGGIVYLLKIAVSRPRPPIATLIGSPSLDFSFPSGHTTDGTTVWALGAVLLAMTMLRTVHKLLMITAGGVVALLVGLSRIYLGYHWATDVLAGWLLAAAVVFAASYLSQLWSISSSVQIDTAAEAVDPRLSGHDPRAIGPVRSGADLVRVDVADPDAARTGTIPAGPRRRPLHHHEMRLRRE